MATEARKSGFLVSSRKSAPIMQFVVFGIFCCIVAGVTLHGYHVAPSKNVPGQQAEGLPLIGHKPTPEEMDAYNQGWSMGCQVEHIRSLDLLIRINASPKDYVLPVPQMRALAVRHLEQCKESDPYFNFH